MQVALTVETGSDFILPIHTKYLQYSFRSYCLKIIVDITEGV